MTTSLIVILLVLLGVAVAILLIQRRRQQQHQRQQAAHRHTAPLPPPPPPRPPLWYEVQQYDQGLEPDRWIQQDDTTWIRRVDAQYVLVDTYKDEAGAVGRLVDLVNATGNPLRYRIVTQVAAARGAGMRTITDSVMRAAPAPERKDPPVTHDAPTDTRPLYDQIGGEAPLSEVIRGFYRRVQADKRVSHRFAGIDMNRLVLHQARAFTILTGGPNPKGMTERELRTWVRDAHLPLGITDPEFTILGKHLVDELNAAGVPREIVEVLGDVFEDFRGEVVRGVVKGAEQPV